MTMLKKAVSAGAFLFLFLSSCKKEDRPVSETDLTQVRITDFQLVESPYNNIIITDPVLTDGVETQAGEIDLVIPSGTTQLQLTPKTTNFNKQGFAIEPALNVKQNFLNRTVIYRIASTKDPSKAVHYHVRIREAVPGGGGNAAITGFSFQKPKNPALPATIESARIVPGVGTIGKIFLFVPEGTDFTDLTPTITHNGDGLYYSQDPASSPATTNTPYPADGKSIDFAYPKAFYLVVKKSTEVSTYQVIVDVRAPVFFAQPAVTTANVSGGKNQLISASTFKNRGNHPISIVGITHSGQVPAGINAVRGVSSTPAFGLLPGNTGNVMASVAAQTYPPGTYKVSSSFKPRLVNHPEADDLLEASTLQITTTISN